MKSFSLFISVIFCLQLIAQVPNQSTLTIDQIMQGEDFVGYLPSNIQWAEDSRSVYFSWNPDGDTLRSTHQVNLDTKQIKQLTFQEQKDRNPFSRFNKDFSQKTYAKSGDIYIHNYSTNETKRITNTVSGESSPRFSGDEQSIVYKEGNDFFMWNIAEGTTAQLSNFKKGEKKPKDKKEKNLPKDEWLEQDQLEYFDILRKRKDEGNARKYRSEQVRSEGLNPIYYGDMSLGNTSISPDLKYIVYRLSKRIEHKSTLVPDFVTQTGYTKELTSRSKVGGKRFTAESWIYDIQNDTTYQISTDQIDGIHDKPSYLKEYHDTDTIPYNNQYEEARGVSIGSPIFSDDSKAVVNITSNDHKDRWIMSLNLANGKLTEIDRQHDDAWIGGPEVGWFSRGKIEWIDNNNIWYKSEKTGYAHMYKANVNTGNTQALTQGDFEVLSADLSKDRTKFFLTTNEVSPHEQHFYHMPATGGKRTQITNLPGGHQVEVSPDEKQLAVRYSYTNKPWELYTMPNEAGSEMTQLTNSTTESFDAHTWIDSEIIRFKARDGMDVPATLYKPTEAKKNGAAVIFVHGAGYLQNVHRWWPSYFREYMFHNFLVDNGYTVLAIDFRASAGYGRDWRTAIYRHMGGKDLYDQIDGAKYLVDQHGIGADQIGIYGGSYGGFITLMALFNSPGTFKSGAALRSVTDWAHYNHGYTSPILNTPTQDSIAYRKSSPIYFAEGLSDNLLMLHGMIDRNVQFQDVVRLSQRLIELKKENWELSVFPLEGHGFKEASSWSDEYRRIYKLFSETLLE